MTRASRRIGRAVARVEALGRAGADLPTYADRLAHELRSLIPHAAACVVTLDPATGLLTGTYKSGGLADAHDEWQVDDRRYLSEGSMAKLYPERETDPTITAELNTGD